MYQSRLCVAVLSVALVTACSDPVGLQEVSYIHSPTDRTANDVVAATAVPSVYVAQGGSATLLVTSKVNSATSRNVRVTWTSRSPSVASVDRSTGVATGLTVGRAWIVESASGVSDSSYVGVLPTSFRLTPSTNSIVIGGTVTLVADADIPLVWSSSDSSVATVVGGVVTAIKAGQATITASSPIRTTATATVTVTAPPADPTPPPPPSTPVNPSTPVTPPSAPTPSTVELPRVYLDDMVASARSATALRTINVATAAQLSAALDTSKYGDDIVLQAGVTYAGAFTLRKKSGSGWITLRSSTPAAQLPVANARMRPSYSSMLPKLVSSNAYDNTLQTELGAHNYRLFAIEITAPSSRTSGNSALVSLGSSDQDQTTIASEANSLVLDRVYIHGTPALDFRRCVALNSASTAIVDSWLGECHGRGADSQAIWGSNGTGPYKIVNNHLEGAGENVMFGGADPHIPNALPADIEIRKNYFYKPPTWANMWSVKNSLELKIGLRVLVEGNIFENNWVDGQTGFAIVLKSTNQENTAPWSQTADVTFRSNIVRNVASGMNVSGHPEAYPVVYMARLNVTNNVFERVGNGDYSGGRLWQVSEVDNVTFSHNTGFGTTQGMLLYGGKMANFSMVDNVFGTSQKNWDTWNFALSSADGFGFSTAALSAHTTSYTFTNNIEPGLQTADFGALRLVGWPTDLRLPANTQFLTASSTGGLPGADFTLLGTMTAGVIVTP